MLARVQFRLFCIPSTFLKEVEFKNLTSYLFPSAGLKFGSRY